MESTENLAKIVNGEQVVCQLDGTTAGRSGRPAAICYVNGVDIGFLQVRAGHARDCPAYSGGQYREAELAAQGDGNELKVLYALPTYC